MLTSKQRSYLRGIANNENAIIQVGKIGVTDNLIKQVDEALEARELVKINVLENAGASAKEIAVEVAENTGAEVVQVIGKKITLYRKSKKAIIELPKI